MVYTPFVVCLIPNSPVFASLNEDAVKECAQNCGMMQRLADALNMVAPNLQTFVYSGGTRVSTSAACSVHF
jgi:hypothetical protein